MIWAALFGLMILGVVIYISLRIMGNVLYGAVLITLILIASYFIIGSIPDLKAVPIIGAYIPDIPLFSGGSPTTGEVITVFKDMLYNLRIVTVGRSSEGNMLVSIANSGRQDLHGFRVFVDDREVQVLNSPKSTLKSGESTVIEVSWTKAYGKVTVWCLEAAADYSPGSSGLPS